VLRIPIAHAEGNYVCDAATLAQLQAANRIIFRWQGVTFGLETPETEFPVSFEIELRSNGTILTRYGAGNTHLKPVVGISAGEPEPCATFRPGAAQVRRFFDRARRVSRRGFLHETTWSACRASGTLRLQSGARAQWMVQRLGAGSLTIEGRHYYFDCPRCRLEPPAAKLRP